MQTKVNEEARRFTKNGADPVGELTASLAMLCKRRDFLARQLADGERAIETARSAWEAALDGDDPKALEKCGGRLREAQEHASRLESELDNCARQISNVETEMSLAQDRAKREAKAAVYDKLAQSIVPMLAEYAEVSNRFADELSKIEGVFDAQSAASIVRQTAESVLGAKKMIIGDMQYLAAELRRDPRRRPPEPPKLPPSVISRSSLTGGRNDPHPPQMWSGDKAFP
ncbi:MAG: hypothetical protein WBF43_12900 [Methylocella sp.]